ncbi:hypothetical protein MSM1_06275 [Mycobacterium sp. SM1]|uniref:hypothetical protein n=1 Tax=Mycobacterium sp. SM1 TaxID=2816243 RepID=UPI001BCDB74F|nr:hypothetical protein [Mycobacterium sp. SM1]MBS4727970.1 hypothetical protein [Mycobacterium sp. SM1]
MADAFSPIDVLDITQKLGEQWVSVVKQSQNVALDVTRRLTEKLPQVPSSLAELPAKAGLPDVPAVTAYGFDFAAELLTAQKDFTVALLDALTPAKTA